MPSFVTELRRRNVLRVAAAYALVAWIIIEAGSVLLPTFGASEAQFQAYVIVVLLGFVVSLVFAWVFEVTPDGVKLEKDVDRTSMEPSKPKAVTNYAIIGLLIVALAVSITFNVTGIRDGGEPSAADIMKDRRSIAVLPFDSRSAEDSNALFTDGVHDDLLTKLANIGTMRVISRTSVMEYRGTTKNLRQIGSELGVDTLLEGTVQRVGDNVRINVQLIDAETDEHLWARIYDRQVTTDNLFTVQSEVSGEIAAALHTTLFPTEQLQVADVPTANLRAYSLYTSGRDNLHLRRLDTLQLARTQFEEAIELDPDYAEAYIALAETTILISTNFGSIAWEKAMAEAETLIATGLDLDPELSDGYATRGLLKYSLWRPTRLGEENLEAEAAFEQALALNPNNARAYMWFGLLRDAEQRPDEAIGFYHRSMQIDPLGRIPYTNLPTLYAQRGENEYAVRLLFDAIELHPDWPFPHMLMAVHLAGMGRLDEAMAWQRLTLEKSTEAERMGNLGIGIYVEFEDYERAKSLLQNLPSEHPISSLAPAFITALDGDFVAASAYLVAAAEANPNLPIYAHRIISDFAVIAGDYENARKHTLLGNPILALDTDPAIDRFTVRDIVKLAFLDKMDGDTDSSRTLLLDALPVVQSLPRLGMFGQGVRDAQIYALLGQHDNAFAALDQAIEEGYRSSVSIDQWALRYDPYFSELQNDPRFTDVLQRLDALNASMYQRLLDAEASGDWTQLIASTREVVAGT